MIDTAAKRRSAGSGYATIPPIPDGTISQPDQQQAAWIYNGILVRVPPLVVPRAVLSAAGPLAVLSPAGPTAVLEEF